MLTTRQAERLSNRQIQDRMVHLDRIMAHTQFTRPRDYEAARLEHNVLQDVQDWRQKR